MVVNEVREKGVENGGARGEGGREKIGARR